MSSIRAVFTAGLDAIVVHGLHQWDYGRSLEISHPDLPAIVEVHFGTAVSKEASVRMAEGVSGTATAAIPDILLEQAHPITAWVYVAEGTLGKTLLTVTLPIQARPRPALAPSVIPEEISDKYTEAVAAMNEAVASVRAGDVIVSTAINATTAATATTAVTATKALNADHAAEADNASSATYAASAVTANTALNANHANEAVRADTAGDADYATRAGRADEAQLATEAAVAFVAEKDWEDNVIHEHYATFKADFTAWSSEAIPTGLYQFRVLLLSVNFYGVLPVDNNQNGVMLGTAANGGVDYMLEVGTDNKPKVLSYIRDGSSATGYDLTSDVTIYYRKIN